MLSLWGTMYSVLYTGIRTCTLGGYYLETGTKSSRGKRSRTRLVHGFEKKLELMLDKGDLINRMATWPRIMRAH